MFENYLHYHCYLLCFKQSLHALTGVTQAAITSFPLVTSHPSHPHKSRDRYSAQAPQTYTHKASRTTTVIDILVVSCNLQRTTVYRQKQQKRSPHKQRAHQAIPTWPLALIVAYQKMASLSKDPTLPFRLICGRCFFVILHFGELSQRVVGSSGRFFRVVLLLLLLHCVEAVFHLSTVPWCCLASSFFYDFDDLTRDSPNVKGETTVLRQQRQTWRCGYAHRAPNHLAGAPFPHPGEPSAVRRWGSAATPVSPSTQRSAVLGCIPVVELCA